MARLQRLDLDDLNRQLRDLDTRIDDVKETFDRLRGGKLAFTGNVDLGGNRITKAGTAQSDNDTLTLGELLERLDDLEDEASALETNAAEDYGGGARQKRLLRRTSRLTDMVDDAVASTLGSVTTFPGMVFSRDDGSGDPELFAESSFGTATVDFGFETGGEGDTAVITVAGEAWVNSSTSIILANIFGATTVDHDPEDAAIEDIHCVVSNLVTGAGFDITAYAPAGTFGEYRVHWIGVPG